MNRSCQRHTQGFETPARRMISGGAAALPRGHDDPRPPDMLLPAVAIRDYRRQLLAVGRTHLEIDPRAHRASSHASPQ